MEERKHYDQALHRLWFAMLALCSALPGYSQLTLSAFGSDNVISGPNTPNVALTLDVDNDGDEDVVVGATTGLYWFENLDHGESFAQFEITPISITDISLSDLNGDGLKDLVCATGLDGRILWYENYGDGDFSGLNIIYDQLEKAISVFADDFDGDGDNDVISASTTDNKLTFHQNLGAGAFTSVVWSETTEEPTCIYAADIDGDGDLDAVSASKIDNTIAWWENNGGTFELGSIISDNVTLASSVYAADLDGDGDVDILAANKGSSKVIWFENFGDGDFSNAHIIASQAMSVGKVYADDIDDDGDLDVMCSGGAFNPGLAIYKNLGGGTFDTQTSFQNHLSNKPFTCDLDSDGVVDVLSISSTMAVKWSRNNGDWNFSAMKTISNRVPWVKSAIGIDIDGDGDKDVAASSVTDKTIVWYENLGGGVLSNEYLFTQSTAGAFNLASADFNNDGREDLVAGYGSAKYILFYENLGLAEFALPDTLTIEPGQVNDLFLDDIDNDGDVDILATKADKTVWFENTGDGSFGSQTLINYSNGWAETCHTADLNGDNLKDIVLVKTTNDRIIWFENLDGTSFGLENVIYSDESTGVRDARSGDIDGDGDMDLIAVLITTNNLFGYVAWFENVGGGVFTEPNPITEIIDLPWEVKLHDLDGDGDLDAIFGGNNINVVWVENQGSGVFSEMQTISKNTSAEFDIRLTDLDSDGDMDVLTSVYGQNIVFWNENTLGEGCTDPQACNYIEGATEDNGSCCYGICGCTDLSAENYNPEAECEIGTCEYLVCGFVFNDEDTDGIWEENEFGLPFQELVTADGNLSALTNDEGKYCFTIPEGEYMIEVLTNDDFPYTTTTNPITIEASSTLNAELDFGVSITAPNFEISVDLYPQGSSTLCDTYSIYNIYFRNLGNVPIYGVVELEYDPLFQGFLEFTPIDSVNANHVYMSFENLLPGQMLMHSIYLETPTANFIGEWLTSTARVVGFFEGDQVAYGEDEYEMQMMCAYDPNDKQVFPNGYGEEHLVLQETELEYLVRFQNTGNAPATNIVIRDTIDVNLDLTTLQMVANSHSVMITIDSDKRTIEFIFENIMLPDSVSNEPDSHGLISYRIKPLPNLSVGTVIENAAYIYFDNNEAVVTNTTWTTIHECGNEAEFSIESLVTCGGQLTSFTSLHPMVENYAWFVDGEQLSSESTFETTFSELGEYNVVLEASNPLCFDIKNTTILVDNLTEINPCIGDFDCNGYREMSDLIALLSGFGCTTDCNFDINNDGATDVLDFMEFLSYFGLNCLD
ncbi:MAG: hypothetical protein RL226_26 [Bacteroidota bacterium]|jgi:uncharacterized repeat protein (TIGR01451 family)